MRVVVFALIAVVAACASGAEAPEARAPFPFPVARGSAPPPPQAERAARRAPPEGVGAGGIDFGTWRSADPAQYTPRFQSQLAQRYAGRDAAHIRADLEANGFACGQVGDRTDCRIEIMERQCAFDWYAVLESGRETPAAGFDIMCLGAR